MKKSIILVAIAVGLLTSCDPSKDDLSLPSSNFAAEQLQAGFSTEQYSDEEYTTKAADGNYFTFTTSPARVVTIYQLDADGERTDLFAGGANGKFKIVPKRGNPTNQKYYIETKNFDGTVVTAEKTADVFVPSELTPEMRLLASDAYGKKVWKWDTEFRADGAVWGNTGYANDADGANWAGGIWWGATPEGLTEQLKHSDTGVATGEENANAYMEFYDDGKIITYDGSGNQIRKGKYKVEGYTGERKQADNYGTGTTSKNWSYGTLVTDEGAILFPFKINGNGMKPTKFEIMQLDANNLKLIYAADGTGGWAEATWWAFKSYSDPEAALTNFSSKSWTWDTSWRSDGGAWGNLGYAPGDGNSFVKDGNGIWFACKPADLTGQLKHSDTGVATGEEDPNAYMTFDWKSGTIKSFDAKGKEIRSGKFSIPAQSWMMGAQSLASIDGSQKSWAYGILETDPGSILWPFKINGNGTKPSSFEIMQVDADHLKLIYAPTGTGSWSEATWWAFKVKK